MTMDRLGFLRHVRSFTEGRVRVRHAALEDPALAGMAADALKAVPGVLGAEINPRTGSALISYDPAVADTDILIERGILWAGWLDARLAGSDAPPPAP